MLSVLSIVFWFTTSIGIVMPEVGAQPGIQIDALFRFMAATGSALFIFVAGYIIYFCFAFRARPTDAPDAIGVQIHDNHTLELWWTLIPTLFVVLLSILSVRIWYGIQIAQPANGLVVESIGHQWFYTFRYPQVHGEITDEMHLPVNVPVVMNVTSSDVIHSFWVPAFRLKADMVPGLINTIRFTPKVPGRYKIICTEFCGTLHGAMQKQDRRRRRSGRASTSGTTAGKSKTPTRATNCRRLRPAPSISQAATQRPVRRSSRRSARRVTRSARSRRRIVGPGLKGVLHDPAHPNLVDGDKATPDNVAKILQQGFKGDMGVMPNATANGLSDKDIANLVAYLNSLK